VREAVLVGFQEAMTDEEQCLGMVYMLVQDLIAKAHTVIHAPVGTEELGLLDFLFEGHW
jgi:hypothetical protein